MLQDNKIWVGTSADGPVYLLPSMSNRHGLIAGATGTGKTVSLKVLAESFSDLGVPVFLSDIKSDLSGMVKAGVRSEGLDKRLRNCGADYICADPWEPNVVTDGMLITGQNTQSAGELARAMLSALRDETG